MPGLGGKHLPMPRAIWTGSISFGLVNVPVRMYSAIDEHDLHFRLVHEKDGGPIGYEKVCKKEGKEVASDEIVKAYELDSGKLVYLEDQDFEAARVEGYHGMDIQDFVPYEQIDPIYFERTYYLGPDRNAEKVYALLRDAMEESELAAIVTFVMREKEQLGCLRVRERVLTLERMFFADEIRSVDDFDMPKAQVGRKEKQAALELIERFTSDFDPTRYEDTYRDALLKVIHAKAKGKEVHVPERPKEEAPAQLLDALMASLESAASNRKASAGSGSASKSGRAPASNGSAKRTTAKRTTSKSGSSKSRRTRKTTAKSR